MNEYFDKNGDKIEAGMDIRHDGGDVEKVIFNGEDYGVNATNKDFVKNHPYTEIPEQIYPLSQFSMKEWEIVK